MNETAFAKSLRKGDQYVGETITQHSRLLLDNLEILKNYYGDYIRNFLQTDNNFWEKLRFACVFHDAGKISGKFQNKIRKLLHHKPLSVPSGLNIEIPHNFLSPAFFPSDIDDSELFYAVVFHHDRDINFDEEYLKKVIHNDLNKKVNLLSWISDLGYSISDELWDSYFSFLDRYSDLYQEVKFKKSFILLKGLLHRLDHSASAHVPVETEKISDTQEKLLQYLKKKCEEKHIEFKGLKPFQAEAEKYRQESILLCASTGTGKTEFSMNWIGKDKAFYTLPLRVSVNAMYERFTDMFSDKYIGLLHSDSLIYGLNRLSDNKELNKNFSEESFSLEKYVHNAKISRQFAMPITITTADQLFTSVFKWKGYEKIYATLMYSKVILDEPQSYSPETLAMIIKALQEISELGGKFCFMSATIHPFVREYLSQYCKEIKPVFNPENKHKIRLSERNIDELKDEIEQAYHKGKKILVIVNTVKKARELYEILNGNKNLLHSGFIQQDRRIREKQIQEDYKKNNPVIWVTTQIVEASLDIDYDMLFTEIASADALFQRMGRVFRSEGRYISQNDESNIVIATETPSDKYHIYNKDVVLLTKEALKSFDNKILTDSDKTDLMNKVYGDKEKISKFYEKFKKSYELLKDGFETDKHGEAQKLFRDICNMTVIPYSVYEKNQNLIENAVNQLSNKENTLEERLKTLKTLNDFTVSLPIYKVKPNQCIRLDSKRGIFTAYMDYDKNIGIIFNNKTESYSNII